MSNGLNSLNQWLQDTIFKPLEDKKMPVMEHLAELQVRLTRAVIITAVVFVATFFYADILVKWLRIPLQNMFMPRTLSWVPTDLPTVPFVFLAPAEALWQNVKVAGLFALVAATPYILVEVWQFVVPGLHAQERRFVGPFVVLTAVAFYTGVGFAFFFVLPFALNFLISYGVNAGFVPQISIAQYVGFALWFLMVFGLIFEVPLAITLMAKFGWVDAPFLIRYWKWALLGSFVIAAVLTPTPDPFNQTSHGGSHVPSVLDWSVQRKVFRQEKTGAEESGWCFRRSLWPRQEPAQRLPVGCRSPRRGDYVGVPTDRRR